MRETLDAISAAYRASCDRLIELDTVDFLSACLEIAPGRQPDDAMLVDVLLEAAEDGSIDAAAALNALALSDPCDELDAYATKALTAVFKRNGAAREELVQVELVRMLEEAAFEMGMRPVLDPVTGDTRWHRPEPRP